jgi:hypothetical protein
MFLVWHWPRKAMPWSMSQLLNTFRTDIGCSTWNINFRGALVLYTECSTWNTTLHPRTPKSVNPRLLSVV